MRGARLRHIMLPHTFDRKALCPQNGSQVALYGCVEYSRIEMVGNWLGERRLREYLISVGCYCGVVILYASDEEFGGQ